MHSNIPSHPFAQALPPFALSLTSSTLASASLLTALPFPSSNLKVGISVNSFPALSFHTLIWSKKQSSRSDKKAEPGLLGRWPEASLEGAGGGRREEEGEEAEWLEVGEG